jgi:hypothetical protein
MVFIKKLPHIFLEIFGLYKSSLYKAKIGDKTDDIKTLIKLTTFELEVSKQKELKVKLFPVLDHMFLTWITSVVPPTRIELVTKP